MIVKLLTKHHLEFLSLKGGCTGSSESTLVKMSNCWKSHALAQNFVKLRSAEAQWESVRHAFTRLYSFFCSWAINFIRCYNWFNLKRHDIILTSLKKYWLRRKQQYIFVRSQSEYLTRDNRLSAHNHPLANRREISPAILITCTVKPVLSGHSKYT